MGKAGYSSLKGLKANTSECLPTLKGLALTANHRRVPITTPGGDKPRAQRPLPAPR